MSCPRPVLKMEARTRSAMSRLSLFRFFAPIAALLVITVSATCAGTPSEHSGKLYLHRDWQLQSSCEVKAAGEQISTAGFDAKGWHRTDIPATVVGSLVTDK